MSMSEQGTPALSIRRGIDLNVYSNAGIPASNSILISGTKH